MKLSAKSLLLQVFLGSFVFSQELKENDVLKEDEHFWKRILQKDDGSIPLPPSPPRPPPTPPTPAVTGSPVTPPSPVAPSPGPPVACNVEVDITCVSESGTSCDELQPPNPICSDGTEINGVTFGYSGNSCNPAGNLQGAETFCEDFSPILFLDPVTILCRDASETENALVVEPPVVNPGASFTVTNPDGDQLPDKIDCIFSDIDETILQQVVVDTSGEVSLSLGDEFGSFTLLSCVLPASSPGGQNCVEVLTYTVDISNTGTVDMDITKVDFVFEGTTTSLLGDSDTNTLQPGESTSVNPIVLVNLCSGVEFCTELNVEAEPPNGDMCQATDEYCIEISGLPPTTTDPPPSPTPPAPTLLPPTPTLLPPPALPTVPSGPVSTNSPSSKSKGETPTGPGVAPTPPGVTVPSPLPPGSPTPPGVTVPSALPPGVSTNSPSSKSKGETPSGPGLAPTPPGVTVPSPLPPGSPTPPGVTVPSALPPGVSTNSPSSKSKGETPTGPGVAPTPPGVTVPSALPPGVSTNSPSSKSKGESPTIPGVIAPIPIPGVSPSSPGVPVAPTPPGVTVPSALPPGVGTISPSSKSKAETPSSPGDVGSPSSTGGTPSSPTSGVESPSSPSSKSKSPGFLSPGVISPGSPSNMDSNGGNEGSPSSKNSEGSPSSGSSMSSSKNRLSRHH